MTTDKDLIDKAGGVAAVAALCECTPQAVSQWFGTNPRTGRARRIPKARRMFLAAVKPQIFAGQRPELAKEGSDANN